MLDRNLYPDNWEEISLDIRVNRAGWKCEWCGARNHEPHPETGKRVVLTVAHLGIAKPDGTPGNRDDRMDCRPENLAALCQRCHLNYDRDYNRERRVIRRGQLRMDLRFEEENRNEQPHSHSSE